jgi:hypothetical protein
MSRHSDTNDVTKDRSACLRDRAEQAARRLALNEDAPVLLAAIASAAARYWDADGIDADDFCVQHVGIETVVFGATNRLVWSPTRGFWPDRSYCTPAFLARCEALGPLPAPRQGDVVNDHGETMKRCVWRGRFVVGQVNECDWCVAHDLGRGYYEAKVWFGPSARDAAVREAEIRDVSSR